MPSLLIHHADQTHGVVLDGRLLIGRAAPGGIVIPDGAVSRIHAWIDRTADGFYIADADSRTGTIVGETRLQKRHSLTDGDVIRVGPATITYSENSELPADVSILPTAHMHDAAIAAAGGILFACTCGAPLWAPINWVGRKGKCAHCGHRTPVPSLPMSAVTRTQPSPQPHTETQSCSICQWKIEPDEVQQRCPSCGLTFHAECWQENKGCSAYGCPAVNILVERETITDRQGETEMQAQPAQPEAAFVEEPEEPFPVEFALLGGSVVAALIGLIAFGMPSLLVAGYAIYFALQKRRMGEAVRNGLLLAAIAISIVGCVAGVFLSAFKWLHHPLPWQQA